MIIVAPYQWALGYCRVDCDPPVNIRDRDVIVISHDSDIYKLAGREFCEEPTVVSHHSPYFRIDHQRIDQMVSTRIRPRRST